MRLVTRSPAAKPCWQRTSFRYSARLSTAPEPTLSSIEASGSSRDSQSGAARVHRKPANDGARNHEPRALRERLVEERAHVRRRQIDALLVALEAEDLVGIDGERQVGEDLGAGGQRYFLRRLTSSEIRPMCSGLEPQQAPTMLQPASSSAG